MFNIHEFLAAFSPLYCTLRQSILHGKTAYSVHTMCSYIAQKARRITGVLSNDIAAILPCTALYVQPKCKIHSIFNIQEFQAAFSLLYCTVSKCILHGKIAYSVHTMCSYIAQNARRITRVSSYFFTIILYSKTEYFTWEKSIKCAYDVFLHCTECASNHGCIIRRYRSDPAM